MGGDGIQMPKFFIEEKDILLNEIIIKGESVNHIKNVLRLKCGNEITLSSGNGVDYCVSIERIEPDCIFTSIINIKRNDTEPPIEVTLFQGIPKSDKMDFIIQKSIELGVSRIVPVIMERTVVRFNNKKDLDNKVARWQRIALEAAKQCKRGTVPQVEYPLTFNEALKLSSQAQLGIIPYEMEIEQGLKSNISKSSARKIAVMIGPEGGISELEIKNAVNSGMKPVTLGPRILRTETAGIAVLSILMYELGDIGI